MFGLAAGYTPSFADLAYGSKAGKRLVAAVGRLQRNSAVAFQERREVWPPVAQGELPVEVPEVPLRVARRAPSKEKQTVQLQRKLRERAEAAVGRMKEASRQPVVELGGAQSEAVDPQAQEHWGAGKSAA